MKDVFSPLKQTLTGEFLIPHESLERAIYLNTHA